MIFCFLFTSTTALTADLTKNEVNEINQIIRLKENRNSEGHGDYVGEVENCRIYLVGDVGRDGNEDIAVQFTLEAGNAEYQYLMVIERKTLKSRGLMRIGGRGYRQIKITKIEDGLICASVNWYRSDDSLANPSIPGEAVFGFDFGGLIERYAYVSCHQ